MQSATMIRETPHTTIRQIRYATGGSALGRVLVAHSGDGICAILFGNDDAELTRDLAQRFAGARRVLDAAGLTHVLNAVLRLVETPGEPLPIPLDPAGTPFQRRVWQALQTIPAGTTASYTDVAAAMGTPNSARAVAQACAANPVAVAVPCHRVVRADGGLSGYRWGRARKQALLSLEAAR